MWDFLIGLIVGKIFGVFITVLMSAMPDNEENEDDKDGKN